MEHASLTHLNSMMDSGDGRLEAIVDAHLATAAALDASSNANGEQRKRSSSFPDPSSTMSRMRESMFAESAAAAAAVAATRERARNHDCQQQQQQPPVLLPLLPRRQARGPQLRVTGGLAKAAGQVPAIVLIGMFHLMIGIPFGVSYFPIGWGSSSPTSADEERTDDAVDGAFPIQGKEALGIRMFLFSTIMGQLIFVPFSGFVNPIGLNMVENVPFTHALSTLVIKHQGYGKEALSTLFVLFGLSSVFVGIVFLLLGKLNLGRVVHYFPTHVLVGLIAGIGVFLAKTGMEVTMNAVFSIPTVMDHMHLLWIVFLLEAVLRLLDRLLRNDNGKPMYSLLSPIYFCMITPAFYLGLWMIRVDFDKIRELGYFFPSLSGDASIFDTDLIDMWTVVDLSMVSWPAIVDAIPTVIALTLFSLIHVPINIPAFGLSTNSDVDMNRELVAHGYSNILSGLFGGLQNYMAYTQSVIYAKSGGSGKASGFCVAALTVVLYFIGPAVASYIPRCMAGTLLLHVGIDLFLEGVYDSFFKFDRLEYVSVLILIFAMTLYGMDAAMIAGVLSAIFTFVAQNMTYVVPVRGCMSAATLRSDARNRNHKSRAILDDPKLGRSRILVVQLQGHLFFGNVAHFQQIVQQMMSERQGTNDEPVVVIVDFSLVLGVDSSAAQAIVKIKRVLQSEFGVKVSIYVSGSPYGFPTSFDLSRELMAEQQPSKVIVGGVDVEVGERTRLLQDGKHDETQDDEMALACSRSQVDAILHFGSHVTQTLNAALAHAESCLIAQQDRALLIDDGARSSLKQLQQSSSLSEEIEVALTYLMNLCPPGTPTSMVNHLFSHFQREMYGKDDYIWKQGSPSTSVKLLVRGTLIAVLENEAGTFETISAGNTIGELGVIEGVARLSTVKCLTEEAVAYSLSQESHQALLRQSPGAARLIDLICISYLSARVQHVSNRIFETRCLPI